jgi:hypothetical protein
MSPYRPPGTPRWPAAEGDVIEIRRSDGWAMWAGPAPGEDDAHKHEVTGRLSPSEFAHRHDRGAEPHDHLPGLSLDSSQDTD